VATIDGDGLVHYVDGAYEYEWTHGHLPAYPGYPYSDICFGLNILNSNQIAIGSADAVIKSSYYLGWARFFNVFWRALGDGYNVYMSLDEALHSGIPQAVEWGYRFRGAGDIYSIKLSQ
jgi:hypothetical protein